VQTSPSLIPQITAHLTAFGVSRPRAENAINVAEENSLSQSLIDQLTFSPMLDSIIQKPSIHYVDHGSHIIFRPTIYARLLYADPKASQPSGYVVEALFEAELDKRRVANARQFAAAQKWAADRGAWFRILTERELRTPYLANVQKLLPWFRVDPHVDWEPALAEALKPGPLSMMEAAALLVREGASGPDATEAVMIAVASRMARCDLTMPLEPTTILTDGFAPRPEGNRPKYDPFLQLLSTVRSC